MTDLPVPTLIHLPDLDKHPHLRLTPRIATIIVSALQAGSSLRGASAKAGLHPSTLQKWLEAADDSQLEPYVTLASHCWHAIYGEFEDRHIAAAQAKARTTEDHLKILSTHPVTKEVWGKSEQGHTAIVVHIGDK